MSYMIHGHERKQEFWKPYGCQLICFFSSETRATQHSRWRCLKPCVADGSAYQEQRERRRARIYRPGPESRGHRTCRQRRLGSLRLIFLGRIRAKDRPCSPARACPGAQMVSASAARKAEHTNTMICPLRTFPRIAEIRSGQAAPAIVQ